MAQNNLPQFPSPLFPQLIDMLVGAEIRRVDRVFRESLAACEYEHPEFGMCGAVASVTDLDSERPMCRAHFCSVAMLHALEVL